MLYVGEWGENDTCYNRYEHRWWLRARAGVAFLGGKRLPDEGGGVRFCRRCGLAPENATHIMWECEDLPKQGVEEIVPKVLVWEPQNILGWLLSVERDRTQRQKMDFYIYGRVMELEQLWRRPLTFLSPE